jgi:glycosyltransferase involved in cell wall biosynthesis
MKLVFVTQAIDADDPNLAATIDMVRALAVDVDEVAVVCDHAGTHDLPGNVSIRTYGAASRAARTARYLSALAATFRHGRPAAVLAHMCPIFLVLAAPLSLPRRVPLLLWYTHWSYDWTLRLATPLCSAVLTVDESSFPLRSPKVRPIGHGIDLERFAPRAGERSPNGRTRFLALGRTEPWKGFGTLLRGFEQALGAGLEGELEIRGPSLKEGERRHRAELAELIEGSELLRDRVRLEQPLPRERLPELISGFDALVSASRGEPGRAALDKVVYEASGCGVPVIACNPQLEEYLGGLPLRLLFQSGDPVDLAKVLREFAAAAPASRADAGAELRRRAEEHHSVQSWAGSVLAVVRELRS